jgi:hypothetical protein
MTTTSTNSAMYWHMYGSVHAGMWQQIVMGESTLTPLDTKVQDFTAEHISAGDDPSARLSYLASFDHEPTEADLDAHRPAGYRSWELE